MLLVFLRVELDNLAPLKEVLCGLGFSVGNRRWENTIDLFVQCRSQTNSGFFSHFLPAPFVFPGDIFFHLLWRNPLPGFLWLLLSLTLMLLVTFSVEESPLNVF